MTIRLPAAIFVLVFVPVLPPRRYFASKTPWAVQIAPPLFCRPPFTPSLWLFGQFLLLSELSGLRRFLTKSRYLLAVYCVVVQAGQAFSPSLRRFLSVVDLLRYLFVVCCGASVSIVLQQLSVRFQTVSALVLSLACGAHPIAVFFRLFRIAEQPVCCCIAQLFSLLFC